VIKTIIDGTEGFLEKMRSFGIKIQSSGGETADVGDLARTIIVDSTVFARTKRDRVISNENIQAGDVIIGLSSFGQASYEDTYNSGIGSNGLTSARHDLLNKVYSEKYPESHDPEIPHDLLYTGPYRVTDSTYIPGMDIGKLTLSPTRTYAPIVHELMKMFREKIHGMVHCTGGGQTKVLNFVENLQILKDNLFPIPPLFQMIQKNSQTDWKEMYQVFNMGHRMEIYCQEDLAEEIMALARDFKVEARIIGRCQDAEKKALIIKNNHGEYKYE
jgi:phosphoribosylformylglycinamidine cyclo-ligase